MRAETGDRRAIVAGVDGSAAALAAVRWAAGEAALLRAPLRLVHVFAVRDEGENWLRNAESVAAETDSGLEIETVLREGDVRGSLLAESARARLVAIGSRGLRAVGEVLMGSAATALMAHGQSPLVVVRGSVPRQGPVVVGVDGWAECAGAARFAFEQADRYGTGVTAVRTWRAPVTADSVAVHERVHAALVAELSTLSAEFADVPVDRVVLRGRPERTLLDFGELARLIVVGTRGRAGFTGVLLGSTSQSLARHGDCPVAIVRSADVVDAQVKRAHHAVGGAERSRK